MTELKKVSKEVEAFNVTISDRIMSLFDDVQKYIEGIFSENQSLRVANVLLLQLLTTTLKKISQTVRGVVDNPGLAAVKMHEVVDTVQAISTKATNSITTEFKQ